MKKSDKKPPLQDRSKQTVKTILDASTRILGKDGIAGLNTNRIAEVAGVSIGSIYQFFRNKESILETLMTSVLDRNLEDLMKILEAESSSDKGLKPFFEKLVDGMFLNFDKRGAITSALLENAPHLIGVKRFQKIDEKVIPILLKLMSDRGIRIRSQDPEMAIFIVLQSVRGVLSMTYARKMNSTDKNRVKHELVDLCVRYLEA